MSTNSTEELQKIIQDLIEKGVTKAGMARFSLNKDFCKLRYCEKAT